MRSRYIIWMAIVALDMSAISVMPTAAEEPANAENAIPQSHADSASRAPHQAVERALEFIEKDAAKWRAEQ